MVRPGPMGQPNRPGGGASSVASAGTVRPRWAHPAGVATRPDPYLVWRETQDSAQAGSGRPRLKVVS